MDSVTLLLVFLTACATFVGSTLVACIGCYGYAVWREKQQQQQVKKVLAGVWNVASSLTLYGAAVGVLHMYADNNTDVHRDSDRLTGEIRSLKEVLERRLRPQAAAPAGDE